MSIEDIVTVQQLVCREREGRDRQWWDEMLATFAEDSFINISWYQGPAKGFVQGSIGMAKRGSVSSHRLGPVVVRVAGHKALATVNATIVARVKLDGKEVDLASDTRLIYKALKKDGTWLLTSLNCVYETDQMAPALPGESVPIHAEELIGYRSSYRCLSCILARNGYQVDTDLPGDDRPDQVKRLYDDAFEWLNSQ